MPTFAQIHNGSFSGFNDGPSSWEVSIFGGTLKKQWTPLLVNESGTGQAAKLRTSKRVDYRIEDGKGWLLDGSGNYVHANAGAGSLSGGLIGRISRISLERRGELQDVTAAGDTDTNGDATIKLYELGVLRYVGSYEGRLQSTETPIGKSVQDQNNPTAGTLTVGLGDPGTTGTPDKVEASHIIQEASADTPFTDGGPTPFVASFQLTGSVTTTDTPFANTNFSASVDLDNGQTKSFTLILETLRVDVDYIQGGPIPIRFSGAANGEVT